MKKIILIIMIILLTGCSYYELDDIALASKVLVNHKDNSYNIKIYFHNKNVKPIKVENKTFIKATNDISIKTPLNLEFSHLNEVVIDKSIDSETFKEVINYFGNRTNNYYVFINSNNSVKNLKKTYKKIKNKKLYKTSTYKEIVHSKDKNYILGSTNFKDCYLVKNYKIVKLLTKEELKKKLHV